MKIDAKSVAVGVALGGVGFVLVSYVLHCHYGLGPWTCQKSDPRRFDAMFDAMLDAVLPPHQHPGELYAPATPPAPIQRNREPSPSRPR